VDEMRTRLADETTMMGAHAPLVTIIIVNYNYGEFIGECIRSVDQQDYSNIQCIVLDCASNDNSMSVIEEALGQAKGTRFQLLRREVNQGHLINSLSALEYIRGVFVSYLDSDDFLFPEFVSTHVRAHLNDRNSAALSVTDQIQVDASGQVVAGTCHWHQKWRAFEQGTAWTDLTPARSWTPGLPYPMEPMDVARLYYIPAWWSSWLRERWIWSTTSGIMFRKSVVESLAPSKEQFSGPRPNFGLDAYLARFAHSVGGTLVVDSAQGSYRRHGRNNWSNNQLLGGQTPNGSYDDDVGRFRNIQRLASQTLVTKHRDFMRLFGGELYYSVAWQLMSNQAFLEFAKSHEGDRAIWERTIQIASAQNPQLGDPP
jgi:glycosyltransferase involved in cell wall biosynthesis